MGLATLALVLASAVIHATWNLWAKQVGHAARPAVLMWLLTVVSSLLYAPIGLWMLSHGAWRPTPQVLLWVLGSGAIHVVYFFLLLRGYRVGDLSLVYPVARGTGPLLAAVGAIALLGERPTWLSASGALLIASGVVALTWRADRASQAKLAPGLRYGLMTGVLIATYTLFDTCSVKRVGIPPLLFYWGGEMARILFVSPLVTREGHSISRLWREHRWRVIGIAALSPLSYILILIALRTGEVGHIAPARELSILIGAYLGGRVLGETEHRRRLLAATAFALGVIALALERT
ncbi:MAG: DMT family transporter [Candidatus Eisenbacteria bacterium]